MATGPWSEESLPTSRKREMSHSRKGAPVMEGTITDTTRPCDRYEACDTAGNSSKITSRAWHKGALKRIGLAGASTVCALSRMPRQPVQNR